MVKKTLLLVLIIGSFISFTGISSAQLNNYGLAVSPAIIELAGETGETIKGSVNFKNTGENPIAAFIEPQSLIPVDEIIDKSKRAQFDASSWITIAEPNAAIEPGSEYSVEFQVDIPENATPGGHYAMITLRPGFIHNPFATESEVLPEINTTLFVTVPGDVVERLEIVSEDLGLGNIQKGKTADIEFRLRNNGNVHLLPIVELTIMREGELVELISIQPQLVLPNTEKVIRTEWIADSDYGDHTIQVATRYGTAQLETLSESVRFRVVPVYLQVLLIAALVLLSVYIIVKWRNIPKFIAVLRGNAVFHGRHYKQSAGMEDLPKLKPGSISEAASELKRSHHILGLPHDSNSMHGSLYDAKQKTTPKPQKTEKKVSKQVHDDTTTIITQTTASTIVREHPQTSHPADLSKVRKIEIKDAITEVSKPEKKPIQKTTPAKKTAPKAASSKKTSPKQSPRKKSANRATSNKKSTASK